MIILILMIILIKINSSNNYKKLRLSSNKKGKENSKVITMVRPLKSLKTNKKY